MTVRGPVASQDLGLALPHEHLFSTFGLDPVEPPSFRHDEVIARVLPHLERAREMGCRAVMECTAAHFGRDPVLLARLSEASGLHLLTNTGLYGAAQDRYLPAYAHEESPEQLAARWIREWEHGIGRTGIRPGFMKLGVDVGPLSPVDATLVRAGALAHRHTGLVLAVHTGNNPVAVSQQLRILQEERVPGAAWIWVHAHEVPAPELLRPALEAGAWVSLDGYRPERHLHFVGLLQWLRAGGWLGQVLLSHDGNTFPRGGADPARPFTGLFTGLLPALRADGWTGDHISLLTVRNPAHAFRVRDAARV